MSQDAPVLAVNAEILDQLVLENSRKGPVLVDSWASWAGPSLRQGELLRRLAEIQRLDGDYSHGLVRRALLVVLDMLDPDDERARRFRQSLFLH